MNMKLKHDGEEFSVFHLTAVYVLAALTAFLPAILVNEGALSSQMHAWVRLACALLAVSIALLPCVYVLRSRMGRAWACVVHDLNNSMADVLAVRKEYKFLQTQVQQTQASLGEALAALQTLARGMQDDQKRMSDEIAHVHKLTSEIEALRTQVSGLKRRDEEWALHCKRFVESLDRLVDDSTVPQMHRDALNKTLHDFARVFSAMGISLVAPERNHEFDDKLHQQTATAFDPAVKQGHIVVCKERGIMAGTTVLKKASVVIASANSHETEGTSSQEGHHE